MSGRGMVEWVGEDMGREIKRVCNCLLSVYCLQPTVWYLYGWVDSKVRGLAPVALLLAPKRVGGERAVASSADDSVTRASGGDWGWWRRWG